jgi:trk system potassium uptake protein TrkA
VAEERKAVVVGAGRVGAALAHTLVDEGWDVTVVDRSEAALRRLGSDWRGGFVLGHGMDAATLEEAGIEHASRALICTNGDNTNILVAQVVKLRYKVPNVVVRILDPARASVYQKQGLEVVCPTAYAVEALRGWLVLKDLQEQEEQEASA